MEILYLRACIFAFCARFHNNLAIAKLVMGKWDFMRLGFQIKYHNTIRVDILCLTITSLEHHGIANLIVQQLVQANDNEKYWSSVSIALYEGNSPVTSRSPPNKGPVMLKKFSMSQHDQDFGCILSTVENSNLIVSFFVFSQLVYFQISMPFLNLHITSLIKWLPEIMLPHILTCTKQHLCGPNWPLVCSVDSWEPISPMIFHWKLCFAPH